MDFVTKLFELDKIPTKIAVLLSVISGLLLFNPFDIILALHLTSFVAEHGKYVGITFLLATGLVFTNTIVWAIKNLKIWFKRRKTQKMTIKNVQSYLPNLDRDEKAVLREFYIQGRNTLLLPIDNPAVERLIREGMLTIVSSTAEFDLSGYLLSCIISVVAADFITPRTLDLPENPSESDRQRIINERPDFLARLEFRRWLRR